jgi:hypothetical protein
VQDDAKMPPPVDDMTDLDRPVTRRELREELKAFATREESLKLFATKDEFMALRDEMNKRFDELRTHFDVVAESFRSDFNNLYDWTLANTKILSKRVRHVEVGHGSRLQALETRVMQLKKRRK